MDIRQLGARRLGTGLPWISFGTVEREREREGEGGRGRRGDSLWRGDFGEVEEGFKFGRILKAMDTNFCFTFDGNIEWKNFYIQS